jgi:EmrB/QacA subfamily drug resistance transporter
VQIADPATTGPQTRQAGWVLAMVIATTALTGLSMSIMVVTFPAIRADFPDASAAQLSWINNLFTIVSAATLIPCGVLADRVGRKRMLLAGALLFTVGSLVGALAPAPGWIMVGRTVQALGAAAYGPAGTALLISAFPPERLASAIGIWAVVSGVSSAAGPSVGGLVVDHGGWQWAFWMSVPIGVAVLALGPFVLRESARDRTRSLPDPLGVLLVMATTSVITLGIVQPKTHPGWNWLGAKTLLCFALGALLLAWFVLRCGRIRNPLLHLDLFRSNDVRYGTIGILLTGVGFYAVNWAFVQHTVNQWGWSISRAGVATCPVALTSGISAVMSSRASNRYGQRPFMIVGAFGVIVSCAFLWFAVGDDPSLAIVIVGGSLLGIASGLVTPAFIATTLIGVPAEQHSIGSSINFMAQRTSATLGTALAITFIAGATGAGGLHDALVVGIVASIGGLGLTFLLASARRATGSARLDQASSLANEGAASVP